MEGGEGRDVMAVIVVMAGAVGRVVMAGAAWRVVKAAIERRGVVAGAAGRVVMEGNVGLVVMAGTAGRGGVNSDKLVTGKGFNCNKFGVIVVEAMRYRLP